VVAPAFEKRLILEHFGPDRLRAGVAAPEPAGERREKNSDRRDDQRAGSQKSPETRMSGQTVELARGQVEDGLMSVPAHPRHQIEQTEEDEPAAMRKQAERPSISRG
jgi:hypothetical protein